MTSIDYDCRDQDPSYVCDRHNAMIMYRFSKEYRLFLTPTQANGLKDKRYFIVVCVGTAGRVTFKVAKVRD